MVESNGGASMAKATSLPAVVRMSFVSYGSLNATVTQYIGNAARSGLRPYCASSSAARSSASGCWRNASHSGGAPAGSGPVEGCASNAPLHVTERSPRMLSVSSAFTWPAFGMPTRMPVCCRTLGIGDGRLPSGRSRAAGPVYLSRSGKSVDAATVCVGNTSGAPARTAPVVGGNRRAVRSHEAGADAVVRLRPIDVGLNDGAARRLAGRDRRVNPAIVASWR